MEGRWLAWTNGNDATFARRSGSGRWRVGGDSDTRVGSVVLNGPSAGLWYVHHVFGDANIRRFDLRTHRSESAPPGINTRTPEISVRASGDYLMFVRDTHAIFSGTLVLYRFSTGVKRVVAEERNGSFVRPGQVNGNFVVYARCARLCRILRYRISSRTTRRITDAIGSWALTGPAVLPNGTVYFVKGGNKCGGGVKLKRWRRGKVGTVYTFPDWADVGRLEARIVHGRPVILFARSSGPHCDKVGIYKIADSG
jgi:hypothetical protein